MPTDPLIALLDDLAAEQAELLALLDGVDRDAWLTPTPAPGWDVRDTIAHLADTDEMAVDTAIGGPRPIMEVAARRASAEDLTYAGVLHGRRLPGAQVRDWWADAQGREREVLGDLAASDSTVRIPWGLGMGLASFLTARLMETWAHGLDVHAALGRSVPDTDRVAHIARLGLRALPYATSVAGEPPIGEPLRVELDLPSGARWTDGPTDARNRIQGEAGTFARVFVQRIPPGSDLVGRLQVDGDEARRALRVARSFL